MKMHLPANNILVVFQRGLSLFAASVVMGSLLLSLAYSLPVEPMRKNARHAVALFNKEGAKPSWAGDEREQRQFARMDNFTDIVMLQTATAPRHGSAFRDSMVNERLATGDNIVESFAMSLDDGIASRLPREPYARYWHGYLVLMKPLLVFWTPQQIRIANAALILFVLCMACISARARFGLFGMAVFFPAVLVLNPVSACLSLQYSATFTISMVSFSFVCKWSEWLSPHERGLPFFLAVGMVTSYFDLLTFPLVTCGLPLAAEILAERPDNWRKMAAFAARPLFWVFGYAAMWSSKWILGMSVAEFNIIEDAFAEARLRLSGMTGAGEIDGMRALSENWDVLSQTPIPLVVLGFLAAIVGALAWKRRKMNRRFLPSAISLLAVSMFPAVWIFLLKNHSFVHSFMASKTFSVTVFALLSVPVALCMPKRQESFTERQPDGREPENAARRLPESC